MLLFSACEKVCWVILFLLTLILLSLHIWYLVDKSKKNDEVKHSITHEAGGQFRYPKLVFCPEPWLNSSFVVNEIGHGDLITYLMSHGVPSEVGNYAVEQMRAWPESRIKNAEYMLQQKASAMGLTRAGLFQKSALSCKSHVESVTLGGQQSSAAATATFDNHGMCCQIDEGGTFPYSQPIPKLTVVFQPEDPINFYTLHLSDTDDFFAFWPITVRHGDSVKANIDPSVVRKPEGSAAECAKQEERKILGDFVLNECSCYPFYVQSATSHSPACTCDGQQSKACVASKVTEGVYATPGLVPACSVDKTDYKVHVSSTGSPSSSKITTVEFGYATNSIEVITEEKVMNTKAILWEILVAIVLWLGLFLIIFILVQLIKLCCCKNHQNRVGNEENEQELSDQGSSQNNTRESSRRSSIQSTNNNERTDKSIYNGDPDGTIDEGVRYNILEKF